jgi:hypothetical protein
MSSKISWSLEDEVESSLIEELQEDISQGLKWKQEVMKTRGEKKGPLRYIVHMGILFYILSTNPTLDLNHIQQKYNPSF